MAELKEKELKTLSALSQLTEPARANQIGEIIGEKPIDVGQFLAELLKAGLAEKTDEEPHLWTITDKGAEYLSNVVKQEGEYIPTIFSEKKTTHSTKPEIMYRYIEDRTIGKKIELFARKKRKGWENWGNEI